MSVMEDEYNTWNYKSNELNLIYIFLVAIVRIRSCLWSLSYNHQQTERVHIYSITKQTLKHATPPLAVMVQNDSCTEHLSVCTEHWTISTEQNSEWFARNSEWFARNAEWFAQNSEWFAQNTFHEKQLTWPARFDFFRHYAVLPGNDLNSK